MAGELEATFTLTSIPTDPTQRRVTIELRREGSFISLRALDADFHDLFIGEVAISLEGDELGATVKDGYHPDDGDEFLLHDFLGGPFEG